MSDNVVCWELFCSVLDYSEEWGQLSCRRAELSSQAWDPGCMVSTPACLGSGGPMKPITAAIELRD